MHGRLHQSVKVTATKPVSSFGNGYAEKNETRWTFPFMNDTGLVTLVVRLNFSTKEVIKCLWTKKSKFRRWMIIGGESLAKER